MRSARDISNGLNLAAFWLLVAAVLVGPASLGASPAFAAVPDPCGLACPCEDDDAGAGDHRQHGEMVDGDGEGPCHCDGECDDDDPCRADPEHDGECASGELSETEDGDGTGEPCQEECPEDCPNCSCGLLGMAMAVFPVPSELPWAASGRTALFVSLHEPALGARVGIFRPPRAA